MGQFDQIINYLEDNHGVNGVLSIYILIEKCYF